MEYLLGVDLGTSGTKTVLFDRTGKAIAGETIEYPLYQPQNGWAEQDADDWWAAARDTIKAVLQRSGVDPADVKGISFSGQMHGLVMTDENDKVLRRSIIWCDGRTQAECDEITEKVGKERLIEISANPALTGFTACKLLWIRKHEPELYARARHAMLPKDYVRFKLTGKYYCEMSDASGTNLLDVPNRCWSKEILDKLEIDERLLPPLIESCDIAGYITKEAAEQTGLKEGTVVAAGAGDNMAAAVGTGVVVPGKAFVTIGTSGVVFAHAKNVQIEPEGRVHSFCSAVPGEYINMGVTLSAGLSLKWYRDQFCRAEMQAAEEIGVDSYILMNQEAEKSPIGANRLIFLPYLMGERSPLMDANARGAFIGLSAIHTRRDLMRAVMEGVSYALRESLDLLDEMKVLPESIFACGGGAKSPLWRQMMADIFHMPVKTVRNTEGPALGAAILAGVACGLYKTIPEAAEAMIAEKDAMLPDAERSEKYDRIYAIFKGLYPQLKESYAAMAKLDS